MNKNIGIIIVMTLTFMNGCSDTISDCVGKCGIHRGDCLFYLPAGDSVEKTRCHDGYAKCLDACKNVCFTQI